MGIPENTVEQMPNDTPHPAYEAAYGMIEQIDIDAVSDVCGYYSAGKGGRLNVCTNPEADGACGVLECPFIARALTDLWGG
jgi:hypothetical protein